MPIAVLQLGFVVPDGQQRPGVTGPLVIGWLIWAWGLRSGETRPALGFLIRHVSQTMNRQ
jgi:hypothetical protein